MTLSKASRVLSRLQILLDTKMHLLQKAVISAVSWRGIEDLPDDVLLNIVEAVYLETKEDSMCFRRVGSGMIEGHGNLRELALVNRRLMILVRRMPSLWTDDSRPGFHGKKFCFLDSLTSPRLDVVVERRITPAFEHVNRWSSLFKPWNMVVDWKAFQDINTIPALENLGMNHSGDFVQCFHLPALRRVRTKEYPSKLIPVMSQLTYLSLEVHLDTPGAGRSQRRTHISCQLRCLEQERQGRVRLVAD